MEVGGVLLCVRELHSVEYHTKSSFPEQVWCRTVDDWAGVCWLEYVIAHQLKRCFVKKTMRN